MVGEYSRELGVWVCGCVGVLPDIGMGEYSRELGMWVCSLILVW